MNQHTFLDANIRGEALPPWFNGSLAQAFTTISTTVLGRWHKGLCELVYKQSLVDECHAALLELYGLDRDLPRLKDEPDHLYRFRLIQRRSGVINGSTTKGLKTYLKRMTGAPVKVNERMDGKDWDEVHIELNASNIEQLNLPQIEQLVSLYGRAMRRYTFTIFSVNHGDIQAKQKFIIDIGG